MTPPASEPQRRICSYEDACRELQVPRFEPDRGRPRPTAHFGERNLEADVGLDQLCDLSQRLAERALRVEGAMLRLVPSRVGNLHHLHGFERFTSRAVEHPIRGRLVLLLEGLTDGFGANSEGGNIAHRQSRRRALQRARQLGGKIIVHARTW